jgi:hypothetical protein
VRTPIRDPNSHVVPKAIQDFPHAPPLLLDQITNANTKQDRLSSCVHTAKCTNAKSQDKIPNPSHEQLPCSAQGNKKPKGYTIDYTTTADFAGRPLDDPFLAVIFLTSPTTTVQSSIFPPCMHTPAKWQTKGFRGTTLKKAPVPIGSRGAGYAACTRARRATWNPTTLVMSGMRILLLAAK